MRATGRRRAGAVALLLLCAAAPCADAGMRRADKAAVIQLFKLLGGPYWTENEGWDPDGGADPCDFETRWYGLGCIDPCDIYRDGPECYFGRATALTLRDNNLTGSITNWTGVGDLHNLTWVDFSLNEISGTLPAEFGNIQNIESACCLSLSSPLSPFSAEPGPRALGPRAQGSEPPPSPPRQC